MKKECAFIIRFDDPLSFVIEFSLVKIPAEEKDEENPFFLFRLTNVAKEIMKNMW